MINKNINKLLSKIVAATMLAGMVVVPINVSAAEESSQLFSYECSSGGYNSSEVHWGWQGEEYSMQSQGPSDDADNWFKVHCGTTSDKGTRARFLNSDIDNGHIRLSGDFRFSGIEKKTNNLSTGNNITDNDVAFTEFPAEYLAVPLSWTPTKDGEGDDRIMTVVVKNGKFYAVNITDAEISSTDDKSWGSYPAKKWDKHLVEIGDVDWQKWYNIVIDLNIDDNSSTFDKYTYKIYENGSDEVLYSGGPYRIGSPWSDNPSARRFDATKVGQLIWGIVQGTANCAISMDNLLAEQITGEPDPTPTVAPTKMPGQPGAQEFDGDVIWNENFENFDDSKYQFDGSSRSQFTVSGNVGKLTRTSKSSDPSAIYLKENNRKPFDKSGALHVYTNFMIEQPISEKYQFNPVVLFNDKTGTDSYRSLVTVYAYNGKLYAINTDSNLPMWSQRVNSSVELEAVDYGKWYTLDLLLNVSEEGTDKYYYTLTNTDSGKKYTNIGNSAFTLGLRWSSWNVGMFDGTKIVNVGFGNLDNDSADEFTVYMDDMAFTKALPSGVSVNAEGSTSFGVENNIEISLSDELASSDSINAIVLEMKGSDGEYTGVDAIRAYDASEMKITIDAELWYNREYRLTIPNSLFTTVGTCVEGKTVTFKTESMPIAIGISDVTVNGSAVSDSIALSESVKISAKFTNSGNNSSQPATLIAAIYDGGVMKSVVFTKKTLTLGASEVIDVTLPLSSNISDNAKIKIFAWDDFAYQTPMSDAKEITITK